MGAAENAWKPSQNQINLAYAKSHKMSEIQNYRAQVAKSADVSVVIHKTRKIPNIGKVQILRISLKTIEITRTKPWKEKKTCKIIIFIFFIRVDNKPC